MATEESKGLNKLKRTRVDAYDIKVGTALMKLNDEEGVSAFVSMEFRCNPQQAVRLVDLLPFRHTARLSVTKTGDFMLVCDQEDLAQELSGAGVTDA